MKNILGIVALVSASMAFAGDADLSSGAHAVVLAETMMQKYQIPGGHYTTNDSKAQLKLDEARKNCQPCLFIEFAKRVMAKTPSIKFSQTLTQHDGTTIGINEFYAKNCPADIYQKIPDNVLRDLVMSDSNKVQ